MGRWAGKGALVMRAGRVVIGRQVGSGRQACKPVAAPDIEDSDREDTETPSACHHSFLSGDHLCIRLMGSGRHFLTCLSYSCPCVAIYPSFFSFPLHHMCHSSMCNRVNPLHHLSSQNQWTRHLLKVTINNNMHGSFISPQ